MATFTALADLSDDRTEINIQPNPALYTCLRGVDAQFNPVVLVRAGPTVAQFSGTVDPETTKDVELVNRATGARIASASVNQSTGVFSFDSVWAPSDGGIEYGFRFLAPSGSCSQTFPVTAPEWNQWSGDPTIVNSAQGSRP